MDLQLINNHTLESLSAAPYKIIFNKKQIFVCFKRKNEKRKSKLKNPNNKCWMLLTNIKSSRTTRLPAWFECNMESFNKFVRSDLIFYYLLFEFNEFR